MAKFEMTIVDNVSTGFANLAQAMNSIGKSATTYSNMLKRISAIDTQRFASGGIVTGFARGGKRRLAPGSRSIQVEPIEVPKP